MNNAYQSGTRYGPLPGMVKFIAKRIRKSEVVRRNFLESRKTHHNRFPLKTGVVRLWLRLIASITLKDIPMELHAQLKNEAAANFRSLTQEAMSRLERTFQIDAALTTKRDQEWMDEAIASGPETPLTKKEMNAIRDRVLRDKK